jgi:16S rRNA G1207 methylase RsmC
LYDIAARLDPVPSEPADRPGNDHADDQTSQYFDDDPSVASDPVTIDVTLPDVALTLRTDRGVFSRGQLDNGTSLLLRSAPPSSPSGDLLDLGCGAGPIALTMAMRAPGATVWAVDVNARARELCLHNAEQNGVSNVRVVAPDEVPQDLRFSTIWSNPPIRIGKVALHELLARWLGRLDDDGTAVLVVQKHLGADSLQRWLDGKGFRTERLASKSGFRLIGVRPPADVAAG